MKRKTFDLIEAKADGEAGWFTALASVFGNVDHVGDRVMPGAFKNTLKKWRQSGRPLPVILSHQWDNPFATIGKADPRAVIETEDGLLVQGQLDIADNDTAKQVHKLMKDGLMTGWSFGYTVPDGGERLNEKDGANELTEIDLVEVGPTLKGANAEAQLQAVKSALDEEEPVQGTSNPAESVVTVTNRTLGAFGVVDELHAHGAQMGDAEPLAEEEKSEPDPLRRQSDAVALELALGPKPPSDTKSQVTKEELLEGLALDYLKDHPDFLPLEEATWTNLSQDVKDQLTKRARQILGSDKSVPEPQPSPASDESSSRADDPLRRQSEAVALEMALGRSPKSVPPEAKAEEPEPEPEIPDGAALRRQTERTALLLALGGSIE